MVPPPPSGGSATRRWNWQWLAAVGLVLVVVGAAVAAFTVRLDYYALRPGSARVVQPSVVVGDDVETYESDGVLRFTTVTLRQATAASVFLGWFDDDIQIVTKEEIFGDRSASENRQLNVQLMDTSKQTAIKVALEQLGHEVPITVTGYIITKTIEGFGAFDVVEVGETIVALDGQKITQAGDISRFMEGRRPGEMVSLTVESATDESQRVVDLALTASPDEPDRGLIGVELHPRDPDYAYPFPIDIDTASVGGPSAGLAFTLSVIDVLSPGDLTGGLDVAVTGTIDETGAVGDVGGIVQKVATVRRTGTDVFIVPAGLAEIARSRAGDDLQIIGVSTLGEALAALASLGGNDLALGG